MSKKVSIFKDDDPFPPRVTRSDRDEEVRIITRGNRKGAISQKEVHYYHHYANPHYVDWGFGSCAFWLFLIIILAFVALILVIWLVPNNNNSSTAKFPDTAVDTGVSGSSVPGLGDVSTPNFSQDSTYYHDQELNCDPWERYNHTTKLCQPRLYIPTGIDGDLFDRRVNQCTSFYNHTCGAWLQKNRPRVENGRRIDRAFGYVQKLNRYYLDLIIDRSARDSIPIFNFYHSCVHALVEKRETREIGDYRAHMLDSIAGSLVRISDLPLVFAKLLSVGFTAPISVSVEEHPLQPQMIPFFGNDGFRGISASTVRKVFNQRDPSTRGNVNKKTQDFITLNNLIEHHRPDDGKDIGHSMKSFVSYLDSRRFVGDTMYLHDIFRMMDGKFDSSQFMTQLGLTTFPDYHVTWIRSKRYYEWLFGSFGPIKDTALDQWKAYVEFSILYSCSDDFFPHLPQNVFLRRTRKTPSQEDPVEDRRVKRGVTSMKSRRRSGFMEDLRVTHADCKALTQELLPGHVSKSFLRYSAAGSPELQKRVVSIAARVRDELKRIVTEASSWMTMHDVAAVHRKLDAIIIRVAHPHVWKEEPFGSMLSPGNYMRNLDYVRRYRVQRQWDRWDSKLDQAHQLNRDSIQRFQAPLSLVNAMYSPITNTITIYAGILQYPFVHERYDNKTMFATIGTIIGHELSHALDPVGRRFNEDGTFRPGRMGWWQRPTVTEYDKRVMCIVEEFSSNKLPGECEMHGNHYGLATITEATADAVGFKAAYHAYFRDHPEATREDKQTFMYSWAQMWCSVATPEFECQRVKHDVHPLPRFRIDSTAKNMDLFSEVMQCPPKSPMRSHAKCPVF